jgi:hypothetical protein
VSNYYHELERSWSEEWSERPISHYVAMLLHPNLKSFYLIPSKKEHAIELLKLEINKLLKSVVVHPLQTTTSNHKDKNKVKKSAFNKFTR